MAALFDVVYWYAGHGVGAASGSRTSLIAVVSSAVIAGAGGWALTRALADTGVLDRFPAGRERAAV